MSSVEQSGERGSPLGVDGLARLDIVLRQNELEWRHITDAIAVNVVVQSTTGTCLFANRTALEYWGLNLEDVMVANYRAPVHPDDAAQMYARRQEGLTKGIPFENELRSRRRDGDYRWFLWRYIPVHDEQGQVLRWYVTGTDIDDRKRAEDCMRNETLALREDIDRASMFEEIVGSSPALQRVLSQVTKVAHTDATVLILGETGTGKELVARAIHKRSRRAGGAFIRVNCAAIPPSLIT
jgi:formate hydrogenlyase transcriptional activator